MVFSILINYVLSSCQNIAHEGKLLEEALMQLQVVLTDLSPFVESPQQAKGSVLLKEVESVSSPHQSFLMHKLAAAGAYIQLFIYLSKSGQVSERRREGLVFAITSHKC